MLRHLCQAVPLASLLVPVFAHDLRAEDESAVRFDAAYTADIISNLHGGRDTGGRYLDNLDLTLAVDAERAMGWDGAKFFLYGLYNNGTEFSEPLSGDFQTVSNIETGVRAARLYEAWFDQSFANDNLSFRVGLYDLNTEFDAIETAGLFINSAHGIGTEFGQTGENGPSIFPVTSLAARAGVRLDDHLQFRLALLDGVPGDPDHPKRTAIKLGDGDGALIVGEFDYARDNWRMVAGYWRYTAEFMDQETGAARRGNDGIYGFAEAEFDRLSVYARAGWASAGINPVKYYMGIGAVYTGPFPARNEDKLGISVAWAESSAAYRQLAAAGKHEITVEMTWRAPISDSLTLQPDLQYVINPGFDRNLGNALVLGLRLELAWGAGL